MALYRPDIDYEKGKKLIDELQGEEGRLIKYYVMKQDKYIEELQGRISEMSEVFNGIRRYTR